MSADYCRATNRILSKRAERDLNAFPLAWCCNSWMLGNKFQSSFPSLYSRGCFILKQMKNLRQSDLCRVRGHSHTSAYAHTDMWARFSRHWKLFFFRIINAMETVSSSASYLRISQCRYDKASAGLQPLQGLQWLFLSRVLVKNIQFRNG